MARKQPFRCGMKSPPFSLIWVTNEPPGRRSISRTLHLAGAGTHHCSKLARSVQALHTTARGALPIKVGDDVIGAVGVSGSPGGDKDEACAKAGLDKVADQLK